MATRYEVDEISFDVPDGYVDESVNVFLASSAALKSANILVTREARAAVPLGQQVAGILKTAQSKFPALTVLGHRERDLDTVPAYEARVHAVSNKVPTYQRQLYMSWYGTLMTFVVSMPRAHSRECDALVEQIAGSLKLKKKG